MELLSPSPWPFRTTGSLRYFDSSTANNATEVCISESMGAPSTVNRWIVAWINRRVADDQYSVMVTQLNALGALAFPPFPVTILPGGDTIGEIDVSDAISFPGMSVPIYTVAYDQSNSAAEDTFILFVEGGSLIRSVELQRSEQRLVSRATARSSW